MTSFSYPLSLPASATPSAVTFHRKVAAAVDRNDFTFSQLIYQWLGQGWAAELQFTPLDRANAEDLLAVLMKLNGPAGTLLVGDHAAATPRGIATGTPLVRGAGQSGNDLITDGWTAGQAGILKTGDYFQLENRLYKLVSDAASDGSGIATLTFWPNLRVSPADNAPLTVTAAKGAFRLIGNDQSWSLDEMIRYGISLAVEEAI